MIIPIEIIFNDYDVIPKYCFDCYKVLITVRSVLELFKLLMIFEKLDLPEVIEE